MVEGTRMSQLEKSQKLFDDKITELAKQHDGFNLTVSALGEQVGGFEDRLKAMGASMEGIREEMQQNFQTVMVAVNTLVKDKTAWVVIEENNIGGST